MEITQTLSILAGVGGLGFGVYQYYQSKKNKRREKNLNELASELNNLRANITRVIEMFESPTSEVDLVHQLDSCAKDILAYKHETGNTALIKPVTSAGTDNISNPEHAKELLKSEKETPTVHISLETKYTGYHSYYSSNLVYPISDHSYGIKRIYKSLENIQENHKGILEEFAPGLYEEIMEETDDFVISIFSQALENSDGVEVDPDEYPHLQEVSTHLFEVFWYYDGVEDDLEKLSQLSNEIEDKRTTILQASYS